jgi:hypothetical protein
MWSVLVSTALCMKFSLNLYPENHRERHPNLSSGSVYGPPAFLH